VPFTSIKETFVLHPVLAAVTERVVARSAASRQDYLARTDQQQSTPRRAAAGCGNLAHAVAACGPGDKARLLNGDQPSVAMVSSYNDVLSAHQPYVTYPDVLRAAVDRAGGVAQFAGGVPAMCDGITQGRPGMELSLFSRDVIAMATGVALAHEIFDAALLMGVCDKIVPGLVIGALAFGHLPVILVPAGPMPSGLPHEQKSLVRQAYAEGRAGREELLQAESASYHAPGTCTFYGTANSNQLLMEVMGLHLPGSSFVAPGTPLREALTRQAGEQVVLNALTGQGRIADVVDTCSLLNGVVALLATGGSTNHTMHLVAMAAAAGVRLTWQDFDELSAVVPLLARIYPNGEADVNAFAAAGGVPFVVRELRDRGLLHDDVTTVVGKGLEPYTKTPSLWEDTATWAPAPEVTGDASVLRPACTPFAADGGLRVLTGNLGEAVVKTSAVPVDERVVEAPARVFSSQEQVLQAFSDRELDRDVVVVLRQQGPRANGMPELHLLTPSLTLLLKRGHKVALVTDGRMSGASGRVLAALHVTPEAALGGPLSLVRDGDPVRVDALTGSLELLVDPAELATRDPDVLEQAWTGSGRDLFAPLRALAAPANAGGGVLA
jgi:phosphogluconate dehydratase